MEGVSPENNEICLEVIVENLARSLKTIQNAKSVKLKLTKKHCPCLTIAAELVRNGTAAEFEFTTQVKNCLENMRKSHICDILVP